MVTFLLSSRSIYCSAFPVFFKSACPLPCSLCLLPKYKGQVSVPECKVFILIWVQFHIHCLLLSPQPSPWCLFSPGGVLAFTPWSSQIVMFSFISPPQDRKEPRSFLLPADPSSPHSREPFMVLKDKQLFFDIITQSFKLTVFWVCAHEIEKSSGDLYLTLRLKRHQGRLDTKILGTLKLRWLGNMKYYYDYGPIHRQFI